MKKHILNKNNELLKAAKKVNKLVDKSLFSIVLDILNCVKKYDISYDEYIYNEFFSMNTLQRESFISNAYNLKLVNKYNDSNYEQLFNNRLEFNRSFKKYIKRNYILLNEDNYNEFIDFIVNKSKIIAKPIYKDSGISNEVFRINAKTDRKKLFNKLIKNNLLLIEDYIVQDKELNKVFESSINSLKITTFLDEDKVHILNRVFFVGLDNLTNSINNGSLYVLLDENGDTLYPAVYNNSKRYTIHPKSKIDFNNFHFNKLDEIEKFVKKLSKKIPQVRYITWNITYNSKDIILIDADYYPLVINIKPSLIKDFVGFKKDYVKYLNEVNEFE